MSVESRTPVPALPQQPPTPPAPPAGSGRRGWPWIAGTGVVVLAVVGAMMFWPHTNEPAGSNTNEPAGPSDWKTYSDATNGFAVSYPASWQTKATPPTDSSEVFAARPTNAGFDYLRVTLLVGDLNGSGQELLPSMRQGFESNPNLADVLTSVVTLPVGVVGHVSFRIPAKDAVGDAYLVNHHGRFYALLVRAPSDSAELASVRARITNSFRLLSDDGLVPDACDAFFTKVAGTAPGGTDFLDWFASAAPQACKGFVAFREASYRHTPDTADDALDYMVRSCTAAGPSTGLPDQPLCRELETLSHTGLG